APAHDDTFAQFASRAVALAASAQRTTPFDADATAAALAVARSSSAVRGTAANVSDEAIDGQRELADRAERTWRRLDGEENAPTTPPVKDECGAAQFHAAEAIDAAVDAAIADVLLPNAADRKQ
ncbi:MAG: hypothetical protein WD875_06935, partial [Pirellulales bacterium]